MVFGIIRTPDENRVPHPCAQTTLAGGSPGFKAEHQSAFERNDLLHPRRQEDRRGDLPSVHGQHARVLECPLCQAARLPLGGVRTGPRRFGGHRRDPAGAAAGRLHRALVRRGLSHQNERLHQRVLRAGRRALLHQPRHRPLVRMAAGGFQDRQLARPLAGTAGAAGQDDARRVSQVARRRGLVLSPARAAIPARLSTLHGLGLLGHDPRRRPVGLRRVPEQPRAPAVLQVHVLPR